MGKKRKKSTAENRYAHLAQPQCELDFHTDRSILPQEVKRRTLAFVSKAEKAGHTRIRIITGKGLHSRGRPMVKPQVERTLNQLLKDNVIHSFYQENLKYGGEGAIVVEL